MLTQGRSRRPLRVLVAAVLCAGLTARLGVWQLDRAQQKLALQAQMQSRGALPALAQADLARTAALAEAQHYQPVRLQGRWLADHTVHLDNRQMDARQGFFVVTPLLLAPGDAVLVQRGWRPRDFNDRTALAPLATPAGEVIVAGRIAPPPSKLFALGGAETGAIRQNLDVVALAAEIGVALRPLSVQQLDDQPSAAPASTAGPVTRPIPQAIARPTGDTLLRHWPLPAVDVGKHHGYAFQWFALCALITGLYVWFQLIRPRRTRHVISS